MFKLPPFGNNIQTSHVCKAVLFTVEIESTKLWNYKTHLKTVASVKCVRTVIAIKDVFHIFFLNFILKCDLWQSDL